MTNTGDDSVVDAKTAIWKVLRDEYNRLNTLYPDKINVKVTTAYPRTVEQLDTKALITISRINAPEETRFVSDLIYQSLQTQEMLNQKGNLQTDIFEIAIWTLDAQYRDDLYLLTRQILFEKKKDYFFDIYKFLKFYRIGGADQELDTGKLPRTIYRAVSNYLVTSRLNQKTTDKLVEGLTVTTIITSGDIVPTL
jgi:hypothetical protein